MASISIKMALAAAFSTSDSTIATLGDPLNKQVQSREAVGKKNATATKESPAAATAAVVGTTPLAITATNGGYFDPELARLGLLAQEFLPSQGITDVDGLYSCDATSLRKALAGFTSDYKRQAVWSSSRARYFINNWKDDIRQRRETLKEGVEGLHPTFEIFDPTIRSFFIAKSIVTPQHLYEYPSLHRQWLAYNKLPLDKAAVAGVKVSEWRASVKRQLAVGPIKINKPPTKHYVAAAAPCIPKERSNRRSRRGSRKSLDKATTAVKGATVTLTAGGRPMSGKLRRKVAKRTFPLVSSESVAVMATGTATPTVQEDAGLSVTVSGRPMSGKIRRRKVAKRTFPWLVASDVNPHAQGRKAEVANLLCANADRGDAIEVMDKEYSSGESDSKRKRARLEESAPKTAPGRTGAGTFDSRTRDDGRQD